MLSVRINAKIGGVNSKLRLDPDIAKIFAGSVIFGKPSNGHDFTSFNQHFDQVPT